LERMSGARRRQRMREIIQSENGHGRRSPFSGRSGQGKREGG
jgi:hypothetical protein